MKVKLIGTGCIGTMQNSACSLINKKILIDIPNGACREIKRFGEDLNSIQTIIITHYHADHIFDLPFIILEKSQMTNKKMNIVGPKDIEKRTKDLFELAFPGEWKEKIKDNLEINFMEILPGEIKYIEDTTIEAVKVEHMLPDSQGYIITIDGTKYYVAGDTDKTKEACSVECDVAFLPVGGTYTMNYIEAAALAEKIDPKYAIPTHYGLIVGEPEDGQLFKELLDGSGIKCEVYY